MNIGDEVYWTDDNGIRRICEILYINDQKYTILLPERNVMIENILDPDGIQKGDTAIYVKRGKEYRVLITKIDPASGSAQIRIVISDLVLAY